MSEIENELRKAFPFGHPRFYHLIIELCKLHNDKNRDYASKENPLHNFYRVGNWAKEYNLTSEGLEPVKVALIYTLKQIDASLKLLATGEKAQVEGIEKRLEDVACYTILTRILYEELTGKISKYKGTNP